MAQPITIVTDASGHTLTAAFAGDVLYTKVTIVGANLANVIWLPEYTRSVYINFESGGVALEGKYTQEGTSPDTAHGAAMPSVAVTLPAGANTELQVRKGSPIIVSTSLASADLFIEIRPKA